MQKLLRSLLAVGVVAGLAACGDDVTVQGPPEPTVTAVNVTGPATLKVGQSATFGASLVTTGTVTNTDVTWSTGNAAVATVTAAGVVTGVAPGSTVITATSVANPSASGSATVTVSANVVSSVTVVPQTVQLQVGNTFTPVATVNADAGVATTVTWSSNAAGVASVNAATGLITAVAPGNAVITATSTADPSKAASVAVSVSAVPNNLISLSVSPQSVAIGPGGTAQIVSTVNTVGSPTVTYTYSTSNAAIATVSGTGNTATITGVANGTAVITVSAATSTNTLNASVSVTVAAASVSISGVTACTGGPPCTVGPINQANVAGQIEVTMNIDAGPQTLDSVAVFIDNTEGASQVFGVNGAPQAPVTLSFNTAKFNASYVPLWTNGQHTLVAKVFPHGASSPSASNTIQFTLNNADVVYYNPNGLTHPGTSALDGGGNTWWKGGFKYAGFVVNYSGQIASVTYNSSLCGAANGASPTFQATFSCSGLEGTQNVTNAITLNYNVGFTPAFVPPVTFIALLDPAFVPGNPQFSVVTTREDNKAPTYVIAVVAYNPLFDQMWVNNSHAFAGDFTISDGGVGVNSAATVYKLWVQGAPGSCSGTAVNTGADLAETIASDGSPDGYQVCASAQDKLTNASSSGASNWFGVDKVAPSVRLAGSTAATPTIAPATFPGVSSTANTTIYSIASPFVATDAWGLEALDTRSGFNQNAVAGFPAVESMTVLNPANNPTAAIACGFTNPMPTVLSDNWVRTAALSTGLDCGSGAPGYFTFNGHVVDRAGNSSSTIARNYAIDQYAAPSLASIGPSTPLYTAGQAANFFLFGSDDLEIIEGDLSLSYPNLGLVTATIEGVTYPLAAVNNAARWDASLNNIVTAGTIGVANLLGRVDFTCTGAAAPYANCAIADGLTSVAAEFDNVAATDDAQNPDSVRAIAYDVASQPSGAVAAALLTAQTTDVAQQWVGADIVTWKLISTGATIQAEHKASTSITAPYFDTVYLGRADAGATEIRICGTFAAPTLTDNGVNRFWTYSIVKPTGGAQCAAGGNWFAIGIKGAAALVSQGAP